MIVVVVGVVMLLYSLGIASLGLFIFKCFEKDMIFRRYYLWLVYHWIKNWRHKDRWKRKFFKVVGLCVYCYTTWISIIFYLISFDFNIEIFLFIGYTYIWLEILLKLLKKN